MCDTLDLPPVGPGESANARSRIVQEFAHASRDARDMARLRALFCKAVSALGFDYFLLQGDTGHAWLADVPPGWTMAAPPSCDVVLTTAALSYAPFLWSDIPRLIALTSCQRAFLEAAASALGAAGRCPFIAHTAPTRRAAIATLPAAARS